MPDNWIMSHALHLKPLVNLWRVLLLLSHFHFLTAEGIARIFHGLNREDVLWWGRGPYRAAAI